LSELSRPNIFDAPTCEIFTFFSGMIFTLYHRNEFVCVNRQLPLRYMRESISFWHNLPRCIGRFGRYVW